MKRILFSTTFYNEGIPQFEAGKHYAADDAEAIRCIARGIAKEVDIDDQDLVAESKKEADPDPQPDAQLATESAVDSAPAAAAPAAAPAAAATKKK